MSGAVSLLALYACGVHMDKFTFAFYIVRQMSFLYVSLLSKSLSANMKYDLSLNYLCHFHEALLVVASCVWSCFVM
jgi:hypothetical protein